MRNRITSARTAADSVLKDEPLFVSQHGSKPAVACSTIKVRYMKIQYLLHRTYTLLKKDETKSKRKNAIIEEELNRVGADDWNKIHKKVNLNKQSLK